MDTISEMICARADDDSQGLVANDRSWSWAEAVRSSSERAALSRKLMRPGPPHICVLLDNVPEFSFWLGATALAGHVLVGGNPNHRGDELSRDISHTECQLLVTDSGHLPLVDGLDLGQAIGVANVENPRVLVVDSPGYEEQLLGCSYAGLPDVAATRRDPIHSRLSHLHLRYVRCAQGRAVLSGTHGLHRKRPQCRCTRSGTKTFATYRCRCSTPTLSWPAGLLGLQQERPSPPPSRGRFSASGFLPDVRRYGVTYFNYVGKPLSYILATPSSLTTRTQPCDRCRQRGSDS